jgi:hypothetical protein
MEKVLPAEAGTILSRQLSRQRRDNLVTVFRPGIAKDIAPNPAPNLPVEHHELRIDGSRHTKPSCFDQAPQVGGQIAENPRRRHWAQWILLLSLFCITHRRRPAVQRPVGLQDGGRAAPDVRLGANQAEMSRVYVASLIPDEVHCSRKSDTAHRGGIAGNRESRPPRTKFAPSEPPVGEGRVAARGSWATISVLVTEDAGRPDRQSKIEVRGDSLVWLGECRGGTKRCLSG